MAEMNRRKPDERSARELLEYVSADCSRDEWLRIAMALHAGLGDAGRRVFDEWSATAPKRYCKDDCAAAWRSLRAGGGVGWGTLVERARAGGWRPPVQGKPRQWTLRDSNGAAVAVHLRIDLPDGKKNVVWMQPNGTLNLGGRKVRTLPLYGSEQINGNSAKAVVIVEGEKATDALRAAAPELLVLGTVTGAASCPDAEVLVPVVAAKLPVYLWPDADDDGDKHMQRVGAALVKAGGDPPKVIRWADAPPKGDAADWADGPRQPAIDVLLEGADEWRPAATRRRAERRAKAYTSQEAGRPVIVVRPGERLRWTREAVKALVDAGPNDDRRSLYASTAYYKGRVATSEDLVLLRTAPAPDARADVRIPEGTLQYAPASAADVKALLDRTAQWYVVRRNRYGDDDEVLGNARSADAEDVMMRYRHDCLESGFPRLRTLRGIVESPTLRYDGGLIDKPGYDDASGLYCNFKAPADWPGLPDKPTRDDARAALAKLHDLVKETPFASLVGRAAWVAALLTVVARNYAGGNVPLFAFSANAPGTGKGTLTDVIAEIANGRSAAKWAPTSGRTVDRDAEDDKRILTVALSGVPMVVLDNVKGALGSPALERALTAGGDETTGTVAGRVLGESRHVEVPWLVVMMATGNNLTVRGDMGRRTLLCHLETDLEAPEERQFRHHPQLLEYVREHRGELLAAALTILAAHGRWVNDPKALLPRVGSFGAWSDHIRSALWWADPEGRDPWESNAEIKANLQPEQEEALAFFEAWYNAFGGKLTTVRDIAQACVRGRHASFHEGLADAVSDLSLEPPRGTDAINSRSLGSWLRERKDRRTPPYRLRQGDRSRTWYVEKAKPLVSAVQAAEQAIEDLIRLFPMLSKKDSDELREELREVIMQPEQMKIIDDVYGPDVEGALNQVFPQVYGPDGEKLPRPIDKWKSKGYTGLQAEAMQRIEAIESLARIARLIVDERRPVSPAFQMVIDRYNAFSNITASKENRALNYLNLANLELGSDTTARDLADTAVNFLKADAAELMEGRRGKMVSDSDGQEISAEEASRLVADAEIEIRKLLYGEEVGVPDLPGIEGPEQEQAPPDEIY